MSAETKMVSYSDAICDGFKYILSQNKKSFVIGQGLWSPWYVGNTMKDLDIEFGKERVIDSPVSELGITGAAIGAGLNGYSVIVVHPRMDFMILAADQIVNQAAKWRHMLGGQVSPNITIRAVINRGGEQGAQHSQALHSWFSHIPGLRVLMPSTPKDARDMLIGAAQSMDPVMYIDDRWCYDLQEPLEPAKDIDIKNFIPAIRRSGQDITIAAASYSVQISLTAAKILKDRHGIDCEVIDVRQLNPIESTQITKSVIKTGRFVAVDGGWSNCGFAGELMALVAESVEPKYLKASSKRLTLPDAPAPSSRHLEEMYYPKPEDLVRVIREIFL